MSKESETLGREIKKVLDKADDPRLVTVEMIAEELDVPANDVRDVLDSHEVTESGSVRHVGAGAGRGWVPEPPESEEADAEA